MLPGGHGSYVYLNTKAKSQLSVLSLELYTQDQMILSAPYANEVIVTSQPASSDRGVSPEACTVAEGTGGKQRGYL